MKKLAIFILFTIYYLIFNIPIVAVSPTPAEPGPDEKIQEIRDAIKEKVSEIKEKIEKKAFVGTISQITDSTVTINNFRGKQRVRLLEQTVIIGTNKKEIKAADLAVEDKIIAMGALSENEILEAKRVVVIPPPKTIPSPKITFYGKISEINSKNSLIIVCSIKNLDNAQELKIDQNTLILPILPPKSTEKLKFKDLKENQKVIAIFLQAGEGKTPLAKTLFIIP